MKQIKNKSTNKDSGLAPEFSFESVRSSLLPSMYLKEFDDFDNIEEYKAIDLPSVKYGKVNCYSVADSLLTIVNDLEDSEEFESGSTLDSVIDLLRDMACAINAAYNVNDANLIACQAITTIYLGTFMYAKEFRCNLWADEYDSFRIYITASEFTNWAHKVEDCYVSHDLVNDIKE